MPLKKVRIGSKGKTIYSLILILININICLDINNGLTASIFILFDEAVRDAITQCRARQTLLVVALKLAWITFYIKEEKDTIEVINQEVFEA